MTSEKLEFTEEQKQHLRRVIEGLPTLGLNLVMLDERDAILKERWNL